MSQNIAESPNWDGVFDFRGLSNELPSSSPTDQPVNPSSQDFSDCEIGDCTTEKIYKLGEPGSGTQPRGVIQDYDQLKRKYLFFGKLFEDETFERPQFLKLGDNKFHEVEWKRAKKISPPNKAEFFINKFSRFDVQQKSFCDCWFQAALAALAMHKDLFVRVVPPGQSFRKGEYAGIFHFRFWYFGRWVDVVVDDYLPLENGEKKVACSTDSNEYWCSLLTKAYVKLCGDWCAANCGYITDAMEDLTGGLSLSYKMKDPNMLFGLLLTAQKRNALVTCGGPTPCAMVEPDKMNTEHSYTISKVYKYKAGNKKVKLIRLRNPWGRREWEGAWSDRSKEWEDASKRVKREVGFHNQDEGEFWMSVEDFLKYFPEVYVCYVSEITSTKSSRSDGKSTQKLKIFEGKWPPRVTHSNGFGAPYHPPQYRITLISLDKSEKECNVIVALMQKYRKARGLSNATIGFEVYKLENPNQLPTLLDSNFFRGNSPVIKAHPTSQTKPMRQFSERLILAPGTYCILPKTQSAEGDEFLLRVHSENLSTKEKRRARNGLL